MKTSIVMLVLVLAVSAVAQSTQPQQPGSQQPAAGAPAGQPAQAQQQPGQAAPAPAPQQKKVVKDAAEYNAYVQAIQQTDPAQKAIALEGFLQQYPNTVMKEDVLVGLLQAYGQTNNQQKLADTANRLLQVNPNNLDGLVVSMYLKQQAAQQAGQANVAEAQKDLTEAGQIAERGLQALETTSKPEGMSDEDWAKRKQTLSTLFHSAVGIGALQNKNYPVAQQNLLAAVKANPNDVTNVYNLAAAYLQAQPPDYINGLWYLARAENLSPSPVGKKQIDDYGKRYYRRYHGDETGWDQVVQQAAASPFPPAGFTIAPAPTPAEVAAKLVQTKSPKDMSFDEIQLILTSGNPQAAETVWGAIKDKPIEFIGKLINATPNQLSVAATAEDIDANKADTTITMAAAVPARAMPKPGTEIQVQAVPVSYTPQPFMITMTKGELRGKSAVGATPPKKTGGTTPRKRTPR